MRRALTTAFVLGGAAFAVWGATRRGRRGRTGLGRLPLVRFEVRDEGTAGGTVPRGFTVCAVDPDGEEQGCITARRALWMRENPKNKPHRGAMPFEINWAWVRERHQRKGLGTALYEQTAVEACRRGAALQSDIDLSSEAEGFWNKQRRKGRADAMQGYLGDEPVSFFRLPCPAPASLGLGQATGRRARKYLSLATIEKFEADMRRRGVSKVARSQRGFLSAFKRAGGDPDRLPAAWRRKREAFIARHMAQVRKRGEPLWEDGKPTRRHLALIAWAYSPDASRVRATELGDELRDRQHSAIAMPDRWWRKKPPRAEKLCYRTKTDAMNVFREYNQRVIDDYGGETAVHRPEDFDAINHKYSLTGRQRANTIAKALWLSMPPAPPFCLDEIDIDALNDTAPGQDHPVGFRLPDYAVELLLAQKERQRWEELEPDDDVPF